MAHLSDNWSKFIGEQNKKLDIKAKTSSVKEFIVNNRQAIKFGYHVAKTATDYLSKPNPFTVIRSTMHAAMELTSDISYGFVDYFSVSNRWKPLFKNANSTVNKMVGIELHNHPSRNITFKNSGALNCQIHTMPSGVEVGCVENAGSVYLYTNATAERRNETMKFLIDEIVKKLDSNVFQLSKETRDGEGGGGYVALFAATTNPQSSGSADEFVKHYRRAFDMGMKRSVIFYGPPGTGKSSLAHQIVHQLGLRTLVYNDRETNDATTFMFCVDQLNIEAVLLDDFDQTSSAKLLGMLEQLNKKCKLVIGLANTTKDFHLAVIRPRRFDEMVLIDAMDESVVKNVLGDISEEYFERVKNWPIAFIEELVSRSKLHPRSEMQVHFDELKRRCEKQLKIFGVGIDDD